MATWRTGQGEEHRLTGFSVHRWIIHFRLAQNSGWGSWPWVQVGEPLRSHVAERWPRIRASSFHYWGGPEPQHTGVRLQQLASVLQRELAHSCQPIKVNPLPCSPSEGDPVLVSQLLQAEWLLLIEYAQKMVLGNWIRVALLVHLCNMLCLLTIWLEWLELVKGKVFPTV